MYFSLMIGSSFLPKYIAELSTTWRFSTILRYACKGVSHGDIPHIAAALLPPILNSASLDISCSRLERIYRS
jgi:hypothetical protein